VERYRPVLERYGATHELLPLTDRQALVEGAGRRIVES
jgi:hypothetical protein